MTHDELLARIITLEESMLESNAITEESQKFADALRAVVELHKPIRTPDGCGDQCSECKTDYPCPTIQAIEKELN
jgi:hypothetical protein